MPSPGDIMPHAGDPGIRKRRETVDQTLSSFHAVQEAPHMKDILGRMTDEDREALEQEINRIMIKNLENAMMHAFLGQSERENLFHNIPVVIDYSMAPNTFRFAEPTKKQTATFYEKAMYEALIGKPKSLVKGLFN